MPAYVCVSMCLCVYMCVLSIGLSGGGLSGGRSVCMFAFLSVSLSVVNLSMCLPHRQDGYLGDSVGLVAGV